MSWKHWGPVLCLCKCTWRSSPKIHSSNRTKVIYHSFPCGHMAEMRPGPGFMRVEKAQTKTDQHRVPQAQLDAAEGAV